MSYAERIAGAHTAYELNQLADEISSDQGVPTDARDLLQVAFTRRCHELWPTRSRTYRRREAP